MSEFANFGDPEKFAISVRWASDSEPRSRRPSDFGWSVGDLKITVGGRTITESQRGGTIQSYSSWYLFPFFDWLATNWAALFHEEDFAWNEKSSAPAIVACHRALERSIGETDDAGRITYQKIQAWYRRHALRAASEGGLLPDLFIRRFLDDIELSWSPHAPLFAPEGFTFVVEPGTARLSVSDVVVPLWESLNWAATTHGAIGNNDQASVARLKRKIDKLRETPTVDFAAIYVPTAVFEKVQWELDRIGAREFLEDISIANAPAIAAFSPAVAMFGGVSPDLTSADVKAIISLLVTRKNRPESDILAKLTRERLGRPLGVPHEDGYEFASELWEDLGQPDTDSHVDIRTILMQLGIDVRNEELSTQTIRGVALAGGDFGPTVLLNTSSIYNRNEDGRRFTLAHELCHILFDRTRARRVTIASGPWVAPGVEKRANAFAAAFLMPRAIVRQLLPVTGQINRDHVVSAAGRLHVSESALVEHIYNIDLIDEWDRERLRAVFRNELSDNPRLRRKE
jgi:Zn-dependent peptidase ImmA (M78 family)